MKANRFALLLIFTSLFLLSACSRTPDITISQGVAQAAKANGSSQISFVAHNTSNHDVVLSGASTDVAGQVVIIQSYDIDTDQGDKDVINILPEITLPAKVIMDFKPTGISIRMDNLKRDLNPGDTFDLILKFKTGNTITVPVTVNP